MFEKDAEEYIEEHSFFDEESGVKSLDVTSKTIFQDGAEFGYNKANEWHDLRKDPNDLPKNKDVMCICLGQICKRFYPFPTECWIGYYDALGWSDYMGSSLYSNVFYWCEIPQFKEQQNDRRTL